MTNSKEVNVGGLDRILEAQKAAKESREDLDKEWVVFQKESFNAIAEVEKCMDLKSDTDPVQIENDLNDWVSYSYWTGKAIAQSLDFISTYELIYFSPKSKELSEGDRRMIVDIGTLPQRSLLNKLKVLEKALERKISVGQSILRYETARFSREK